MTREKILVVDDEETVAEYCSGALEAAGYDVVSVNSGDKAIELANAHRFGVLLTDIKMAGMDGLATFRAIREFDPDIAGIVMTGYGSLENAMQALQLGFSWFLAKPFTIDELTSAVERTLENVRLARENGRLRALINLHELAQASGQQGDVGALMTSALHITLKETGADAASIALLDDNLAQPLRRLCVPTAHSDSAPIMEAEHFMTNGVTQIGSGRAFQPDDAGSPVLGQLMQAAGLAASLCIPLMSAGDVIATLTAHKYQRKGAAPFSEADLQSTAVIAGHAAIAISNVQLRQKLERQPSPASLPGG
jgi:CheY-like chemotaxis protein